MGKVNGDRLAGKAALVTGASRGIGAAIARAFAAQGARVTVGYHSNAQAAAQVVAEIGGDAFAVALDVADRASVETALDAVVARFGRLDVLVNNAGILKQTPFLEIDEAEWDSMLAVNLKGVFLCTQGAARRFGPEGGAVVNLSSMGGQMGGPKAPHYAAAKAAVISFTRSTARLLAPNVRVNAIAPGFIRTEMYEHIMAQGHTTEDAVVAGVPLARVGEPADVAEAAVFLASDAASYVTGQVINVNGGVLMV
ncbi:glucose 1-dehydrogenase [Magnetospirillum aberrantis SpK]|uniref:Glucose 1-dehydrogenase n=1 Tax=Magnetospirillum aberrantis SpK TaxID=908842 RepID=A0A7C9UXW4_9PROT|nr:glucose 1-dehydrogenase [Magnetospirillum aberrantis]NFV81172.1 glucose 1-dehydrogenase [Magnetospirillum aberrantis SpK]